MGDSHVDSDAVTATEATPLLAAGTIAPTVDPDVSEAVTAATNGPARNGAQNGGHDGVSEEEGKPLPVAQILLLCYARLVEPIAFFSIFPYISEMTQKNGNLEEADVGFYAGLIESLFSLTQMAVMMFWGRAADRFGRHPVLVISLIGVTGATAVFGLATSIWQMVLFRCLAGVFAGTLVTIRTMIAEHSTSKTQARAFSWFAFTGNVGILLGPLIGGALANPASQYGGVFARVPFFVSYPYALSSLVVSLIGATSAFTTAFFVEETLKKDPSPTAPRNDDDPPRPLLSRTRSDDKSIRTLIHQPGVAIVLYVYAHVMLLAFAYTAIVPVYLYTPVALGGFGFAPPQITLMMCLNGLAQAVWLLLVFPPLQHRLGTNGVMRVCAYAYPVFFALQPGANLLLRKGHPRVFWGVVQPVLMVGCGVSMSFTAIQLAVNDVAPSPRVLGTLNALALTGASGIRAFSPAAFTSLFALGARTQWLDGYAIWVLMTALAAGFSAVVNLLPNYDKLKKDREEEVGEGR